MHGIYLFIINTNILVAVASFSLYKVSDFLFGFNNFYLGCFVFFSTLFAYNYMRLPLIFKNENNNLKSIWLQKNKFLIYLILLISGFSSIYLCFFLGNGFFQFTMPAIIVSFLYPINFNINRKQFILRDIPLLKLLLIAFTWSYITLIVPVLYFNIEIDLFVVSSFFQRMLFVAAISIPFDIKDSQWDSIRTLPNTIGVNLSKFFAFSCLLVFDILLIINFINNDINLDYFIAVLLIIELSAVIIYYSNTKRSFVFYGILVDSLPIIMYIFIIIASMI